MQKVYENIIAILHHSKLLNRVCKKSIKQNQEGSIRLEPRSNYYNKTTLSLIVDTFRLYGVHCGYSQQLMQVCINPRTGANRLYEDDLCKKVITKLNK